MPPSSEVIRAITPAGIKLGSTEFPFVALGPAWMLRHIFYLSPESTETPRFAFKGEDYRGLALLAEMAIRYDLVGGYLQAYSAWLPAERIETQKAIRKRMGGRWLQLEKAAGEAWSLAYLALRDVKQAIDRMHPDLRGEDEFWADKSGRKAFVDEVGPELLTRLTDALAALSQFRNNEEFQTTVWGIISRMTPRLDIAFAGERIGRLETTAPPEDEDDGDPEGGDPESGDPEGGAGEPDGR